jgi:outer membrane protein assembly factor BamB
VRRRLALLSLCAALALSACDTLMSDDANKVPLKGERISVLDLQNTLSPDPALQGQPPQLPAPWTNQFWPQSGGYANHAMGHPALGPNIKEVWHVSIGEGGSERTPLTSGPVVADGMVFTIDTVGEIAAFDLSTGRLKWHQSSQPRGEEEKSALGGGLAWSGGTLFVTSGFKELRALSAANGALQWKATLPALARSAPSVADGRVYVITLDNRLLVFSAKDGSPLWNHAGVAEETNLLGAATVAADSSLAVLPLSSGEILGFRPENGQVAWEDNLSAVRRMGALGSIADIRALPVIEQGTVFAASYSGRTVALDEVTGRRLWQREVGSSETPWVAGDTVFMITSEQQLAAFARQSGGIRWTAQLPRYRDKSRSEPVVWTGPVLAGGRLFVASSGDLLLEIDPATGKVTRKTDLGSSITIPPVVAANTLLLLLQDGRLIAYR